MMPTAGYYPIKLTEEQGKIQVTWQNLAGESFREPFFEDTLRSAKARGVAGDYCQTWLHEMSALDLPPAIPPTAFIFHTSRSGSTLLTQLLGGLEGCLALSEPSVIDDLLQLAGVEDKAATLRRLILALAQRRAGGDRHFFLKYDSWHVAWFPVIKLAFPHTPCFFIHRHPLEILWSHHKQRGSQMVPGLRSLAGLDVNAAHLAPGDLDGYAAAVLESVFTLAVKFVASGGLIPVDHRELLTNPLDVVSLLGVALSPTEAEQISQRCGFHSKQPGNRYEPQSEQLIPESVRQRLDRLVKPVLLPAYQVLNGFQLNQTQPKTTIHA